MLSPNITVTANIILLVLFSLSFPAAADDQIRQRIEAWSSGYAPVLFEEKIAYPAVLQEFYAARQFQPAWFAGDRLSQTGRELIQAIAAIEKEGLLPSDYHFSTVEPLLNNKAGENYFLHDLVLSDAFLILSSHLLAGKIDPASLTSEWKANRRQSNLLELLVQALEQKNITQSLNKMRPNQVRYFRLVEALTRINSFSVDNWEPIVLTPAIKPGGGDSRISVIRQRLAIWGDLEEVSEESELYDSILEEAVKKFQYRHGLDADGVIGGETLQALNISPAQRARQITVNLERWRWLAEDFGSRFLIVNIAAFELKIIENNETTFTKPVVVGRNYRKTPVFSDKIRYIVFNPTWTVPFKLAVQDKLPEIQRNRDYLKRLGFTVYQAGTSTAIDPDAIDWSAVSRSNFPFRLVQSPGPENALGQVKFMFPNPYDIYLHDTPSRELFKKSERAFSSGCIRVSDPLELAEVLLRDQQWTKERIDATLKKGVTETVNLKEPMPVHIEYWTAWVDRGGVLHFRKDIYSRDDPLWNALQKPLSQFDSFTISSAAHVSR